MSDSRVAVIPEDLVQECLSTDRWERVEPELRVERLTAPAMEHNQAGR